MTDTESTAGYPQVCAEIVDHVQELTNCNDPAVSIDPYDDKFVLRVDTGRCLVVANVETGGEVRTLGVYARDDAGEVTPVSNVLMRPSDDEVFDCLHEVLPDFVVFNPDEAVKSLTRSASEYDPNLHKQLADAVDAELDVEAIASFMEDGVTGYAIRTEHAAFFVLDTGDGLYGLDITLNSLPIEPPSYGDIPREHIVEVVGNAARGTAQFAREVLPDVENLLETISRLFDGE